MTNAAFSRLVVHRTSPDDIKMRDLYIRVDDLPERTLLYGESTEYDLPPGVHHLKVTNRLFSKRAEVLLEEGQILEFAAANTSAGCIWAPLYIVSGTGGYNVRLEPMEQTSAPASSL